MARDHCFPHLELSEKMKYRIILLLTNGTREVIPATRFSVPTVKQIADIEQKTRSEAKPQGETVWSWYRVKV